jgi:tRNA U38,U39,U40 pseudouridine synthase TruA
LSIFQKNAEEIADLLTRAGVETENIETRGAARTDKAFHANHRIVASSKC